MLGHNLLSVCLAFVNASRFAPCYFHYFHFNEQLIENIWGDNCPSIEPGSCDFSIDCSGNRFTVQSYLCEQFKVTFVNSFRLSLKLGIVLQLQFKIT